MRAIENEAKREKKSATTSVKRKGGGMKTERSKIWLL